MAAQIPSGIIKGLGIVFRPVRKKLLARTTVFAWHFRFREMKRKSRLESTATKFTRRGNKDEMQMER